MPWQGKPFAWAVPEPYVGFLPEPQEAGVNVLRQLNEMVGKPDGLEDGGEIKITVNYLESPSVGLAAALFLRANNLKLKLNIKVKAVPKPDPRKSRTKKRLWKYWFKSVKPAVPAPPESIAKGCASLAARPYSYEQNWRDAKSLAQKAKPDQIWQILAVMVHPPLPPADVEAWVWLQRVQLAAAQWVANIEVLNNIPLEQSALLDVLLGPIDWTTDAAIIALTQRARESGDNGEWLGSCFFDVLHRVPKQGYWSTLAVGLHNILLLPGISDEVRDTVVDTLRQLE